MVKGEEGAREERKLKINDGSCRLSASPGHIKGVAQCLPSKAWRQADLGHQRPWVGVLPSLNLTLHVGKMGLIFVPTFWSCDADVVSYVGYKVCLAQQLAQNTLSLDIAVVFN